MGEPVDQLKQTLQGHGQNITRQRLQVFAALQDQEPQTMLQLVERLRGRLDRASVYRTITVFEKLGVTQRLQIGWKYKIELSDSFHHHHHHLTCLKCGKTSRLREDRALEARLHGLANAEGFRMNGHQLEIQGLCANCQLA